MVLALEYIVLALIFAVPAAFAAYFLYTQKRVTSNVLANMGYAYFGLLMAACLVLLFTSAGGAPLHSVDLLSPGEGEFEFTMDLSWTRVCWLAALNAVALFFVRRIHALHFSDDKPALVRFVCLLSAFWAAALAILMRDVWVTILCSEAAVFALHAFATAESSGGKEVHSAYLHRILALFACFLGLLALTAFKAVLPAQAAALGTSLYLISLLLALPSLQSWAQSVGPFFLFIITLFVLYRAGEAGFVQEQARLAALPLMVGGLFFVGRALFAAADRSVYFWYGLSAVCYAGYTRLYAGSPVVIEQIIFALTIFLALAAIGFLLSSRLASGDQPARGAVVVPLIFAVHYYVWALPGSVQHALPWSAANNGVEYWICYTIQVFVASLALGKLAPALLQGKRSEPSPDRSLDLLSTFPALGIFIVVLAVFYAGLESFRFSLLEQGSRVDLVTFVSLSLVACLMGLIGGYFLGKNPRFLAYLDKREQLQPRLLPRLDAALYRANEVLALSPSRLGDRAWKALERAADSLGQRVRWIGSEFLDARLGREFGEYLRSASLYVRTAHSGNARFYLFSAVTILLIALFTIRGMR